MATSYSVFIKMHTQGASQTSNDIKKVETSSKSASLAADGLSKTLGILAGALAVGKVVAANDAWITYTNTLKATGLAGDQLLKTQQDLFDIAQQTRVGISETADIYRALRTTIGEAGASEEDLLKVTRALNEGIIQSGASAQQAQGGIIQLSQVFEKGKLQAQEYNSIVSDFPAIGNLLRQAYLQASGGTETFRQQMEEGKVTAQSFFNALKIISPELDKTQSSMQETAEQGVTVLSNSFKKLVGEVSNSSAITSTLSGVFNTLTTTLTGIDEAFNTLATNVNSAESAIKKFIDSDDISRTEKFKTAVQTLEEGFLGLITTTNTLGDGTLPKLNNELLLIPNKSKGVEDVSNAFKDMGVAANIANSAVNSALSQGLQQNKASALEISETIQNLKSASSAGDGETIFSQKDLDSIRQAETNLNQLSPVMTKVKSQAISMGQVFEQSFAGSFGSAVANIVTGSQSASEAFKQMANSIISDLIRIGIERATLAAFGSLFGGFFGGGASAAAGAATSSVGGAFAQGAGAAVGGVAASAATTQFSRAPSSANSFLARPDTRQVTASPNFNNLRTTSTQPTNFVINTTVNNTNQGSNANPNDQQRQSSEQAKLIANLVNTQVKQELVKQTRVGGMLHSGSK